MNLTFKQRAFLIINPFIVLLGIGFWATRKSPTRAPGTLTLHENSELLRSEALRHIIVGSDIRNAKPLMERNGFGCAIWDSAGHKPNLNFPQAAASQKQFHLSCARFGEGWTDKRWFVDIYFRKYKVTKVEALFVEYSGLRL